MTVRSSHRPVIRSYKKMGDDLRKKYNATKDLRVNVTSVVYTEMLNERRFYITKYECNGCIIYVSLFNDDEKVEVWFERYGELLEIVNDIDIEVSKTSDAKRLLIILFEYIFFDAFLMQCVCIHGMLDKRQYVNGRAGITIMDIIKMVGFAIHEVNAKSFKIYRLLTNPTDLQTAFNSSSFVNVSDWSAIQYWKFEKDYAFSGYKKLDECCYHYHIELGKDNFVNTNVHISNGELLFETSFILHTNEQVLLLSLLDRIIRDAICNYGVHSMSLFANDSNTLEQVKDGFEFFGFAFHAKDDLYQLSLFI